MEKFCHYLYWGVYSVLTELLHRVCPYNDVHITHNSPRTERLQYKTLPGKTEIREELTQL